MKLNYIRVCCHKQSKELKEFNFHLYEIGMKYYSNLIGSLSDKFPVSGIQIRLTFKEFENIVLPNKTSPDFTLITYFDKESFDELEPELLEGYLLKFLKEKLKEIFHILNFETDSIIHSYEQLKKNQK